MGIDTLRGETNDWQGPRGLVEADQAWLERFGVDQAWQGNSTAVDNLIAIGSVRLDASTDEVACSEVISARQIFFTDFIGLDDKVVAKMCRDSKHLVSPGDFIDTQRVMGAVGIDGSRAVDAPIVLMMKQDIVKERIDNLTAHALDPVKVVNNSPSVLKLKSGAVTEKMLWLERTARLLKWEGSIAALVEDFPGVLGFNIKKLQILRRIAAHYTSEESRYITNENLRSALIVPIEKYLLTIAGSEPGELPELNTLRKDARSIDLSQAERRQRARRYADPLHWLGRVGTMYLQYIDKYER